MVKDPPANVGNTGSIPALGRSQMPCGSYRKLNIKLQYDPAIPLLGIINPDKIRIQKDTCTPVFIAALFTIAKTYNGLLLSH